MRGCSLRQEVWYRERIKELEDAIRAVLVSMEACPGANTPGEIYRHLKHALGETASAEGVKDGK